MKMKLDLKDLGAGLQGIGAVAGAWGQYESEKKRNKLLQEQLDYAKKQDALSLAKENKAQKNLEDAFSYSDLNPNKKKKKKTDSYLDSGSSVNV